MGAQRQPCLYIYIHLHTYPDREIVSFYKTTFTEGRQIFKSFLAHLRCQHQAGREKSAIKGKAHNPKVKCQHLPPEITE